MADIPTTNSSRTAEYVLTVWKVTNVIIQKLSEGRYTVLQFTCKLAFLLQLAI
jgi:hypothetical protein